MGSGWGIVGPPVFNGSPIDDTSRQLVVDAARSPTWARSDEMSSIRHECQFDSPLTFDDLRFPKIGTLAASVTHRTRATRGDFVSTAHWHLDHSSML